MKQLELKIGVVLEAANLEEAIAWGQKAVVACRASVEVRQILFRPAPKERSGATASLVEQDNQLGFEFPGLGRRKIEANFAGGQVSSDGGLMLLRQVDRWLVLPKSWIGFYPTDETLF